MSMRRKLSVVLFATVAIAAVVGAGVGISAASTAYETAHGANCSVGATGPEIKYPNIYALGFFCSPTHRTDKATVILQGHINGSWKPLSTVTKQLDMSPGKKYTLKTPSIHCTAHPHYVDMRGYASLVAGPPTGTIQVHNIGERTYCIS